MVNQIHNQFAVNASRNVINSDNASSSVVLDAKDDAFSLGVAVGVAGGKGKFNAAGSVVVSNVDQGASVAVNDLTSTVNHLNVHADSAATTVNVGGSFGVNVGDGAIGAVGASVVVANTNNTASADVDALNLSSVQFSSSKLDIVAATVLSLGGRCGWSSVGFRFRYRRRCCGESRQERCIGSIKECKINGS